MNVKKIAKSGRSAALVLALGLAGSLPSMAQPSSSGSGSGSTTGTTTTTTAPVRDDRGFDLGWLGLIGLAGLLGLRRKDNHVTGTR